MRIMQEIVDEIKARGFLNSRISGSHPGSTISVGGLWLNYKCSQLKTLDLSDLGFTKNKVHQLIRGYYQPEPLKDWLSRIEARRAFGSIDADETFFPGGDHGHDRGPLHYGDRVPRN